MIIPQNVKRSIKIDLVEHVAKNNAISLAERCDILHMLNVGFVYHDKKISVINNISMPFRTACIYLYSNPQYKKYFDEICIKIINSRTPTYMKKDGGIIVPPVVGPTKEASILMAIKKQPLPNPVNVHVTSELPKMIVPVKTTFAVKTPKIPATIATIATSVIPEKRKFLVYGDKNKLKILTTIFTEYSLSYTGVIDHAHIILIDSVDEYFNFPQGYNRKFVRFLAEGESLEKANPDEIVIHYDFTAGALLITPDKILI